MAVLADPLRRVVDGRMADRLSRALDLHTVGDLLGYYPRRYAKRGELTDLRSLRDGEHVTVLAEVASASARKMNRRSGTIFEAVVTDGHGRLTLTFFGRGRQDWRERELVPGARGLFAGQVSTFRGKRQLTHPDYEMLSTGDAGARAAEYAAELIPVYPATAKISTWQIARSVRLALDMLDVPEDPLPKPIRDRYRLYGYADALRGIHRPVDDADRSRAVTRLKWDEALALQVVLAQRRRAAASYVAIPRPGVDAGLLEAFDAGLPFELTIGQQLAGATIADELSQDHAMHRLLQGEVGSGKTVVAVRAMLQVVDAAGQAVLLAPTEVLAQQHYRSIAALLGPLGRAGQLDGAEHATRITLLTGSQGAASRRKALLEAASGEAGIVIGTHALLEERVQFADLGLVVIDEQHKFGVEQRDALRDRAGDGRPHVLVMTATPIPRTVAMTVYGDLEVSTLTELPAGRSPIVTHVVPAADKPHYLTRTWDRIREEVAAGRQAYVVCPRIGGADEPAAGHRRGKEPWGEEPWSEEPWSEEPWSEEPWGAEPWSAEPWDEEPAIMPDADSGGEAERSGGTDRMSVGRPGEAASVGRPGEAASVGRPGEGASGPVRPPVSVLELAPDLASGPLAGLRLASLHGRMPAEEKDAVMLAFAAGKLDVLVTTTVVEVGVDVPNATVMAVMDADRFGVSQLHQLRGRVGRGSHEGLCLLVTEAPDGSPARARLDAVAETVDGFTLSRLDLAQRREGDVLGSAQAGRRSSLRLLTLLRDEDLIGRARTEAIRLVDADPALAGQPALAEAIRLLFDPDQTEYLEKA